MEKKAHLLEMLVYVNNEEYIISREINISGKKSMQNKWKINNSK